MASHETKQCPRCAQPFECKMGNITACQCQTVLLTEDDRKGIAASYDDCLCAACLTALKKEMKHEPASNRFSLMRSLFRLR